MIAVGVGCRKECSGDEIVALVRSTLAELPADVAAAGLYTLTDKQDEPGLHAAAAALALPLIFLSRGELGLVAERAKHRSQRVEALFGVPSVAETAALAGAGAGGRLLVSRRASAAATCAVAASDP